MKSLFSRGIGILLCVALVVGMMPETAYASENPIGEVVQYELTEEQETEVGKEDTKNEETSEKENGSDQENSNEENSETEEDDDKEDTEKEDTEIEDSIDGEKTNAEKLGADGKKSGDSLTNWPEGYDPENDPANNPIEFVPGVADLEDSMIAPVIEEDADSFLGGETLPSSYMNTLSELTAAYPDTRNQGAYGTCWAHAMMSCAEISMIRQGFVSAEDAKSVDYSDLQLAYFAFHKETDPMGGTAGDTIEYDNNATTNYLNKGYNYEDAARVLYQWMGDTTEETIPYSRAYSVLSSGLSASEAFDNNVVHLREMNKINIRSNPDLVKKAVRDSGAVGIYYYNNKDAYANGCSYYCPTAYRTNHAVTIVGWDDNYSADNFRTKPEGDGAWVIRNSWSSSSCLSYYSYFYMSYYDKSIFSTAYEMIFEPADLYDNNYQYDGGRDVWTDTSHTVVANSFVVQGTDDSPMELLEAVSFSNYYVANVDYEIKIYKDVTVGANNDPISQGTYCESATTSGTTTYAGFHTVRLKKAVPLTKGSRFTVVITTNKPAIDRERGCSGDVFRTAVASHEKESFSYRQANGVWANDVVDYSSYNGTGNYVIRAYTTNVDATLEGQCLVLYEKNKADGGSMTGHTITDVSAPTVLKNCEYTRIGYVFDGWNTQADGNGTSYAAGESVTHLGDYGAVVRLYAQWKPIKYSVRFDPNGGTGSLDNLTEIAYDSEVTLPGNSFTNGDLVFDSYNTKADGTGSVYPVGEKIKNLTTVDGAVITLYAHWIRTADYFTIVDGTVTAYRGTTAATVVVPEGVTSLGAGVFKNHNEIYHVVLPDSLLGIGSEAFFRCENLQEVIMPDSVMSLGKGAFKYCLGLKKAHISNSVYTIPDELFYYANQLEEVEIPGTVLSIGASAFMNVPMKKIIVPDGCTTIGDNAFEGCKSAEVIYLPDSLTRIGEWAFWSCQSVTELVVPNGVTALYKKTFSGCSSLEKLTLPDGLTFIGERCFEKNSSLTEIELPYLVTSLGKDAFIESSNLSKITVHGKLETIGTNAFVTGGTTVIYGPDNCYAKEYALQQNLTYSVIEDDPARYYIDFSAEGAYGSMSRFSVIGRKMLPGQEYARPGYEFDHWNTKPDDSGISLGDRALIETPLSTVENDVVTLYAQWRACTYKVSLKLNGGTLTGEAASVEVSYLGTYGDLPTPTRDGYSFVGWSSSNSFFEEVKKGTAVTLAEDHELYAFWKSNEYYVNLIAGEEGIVSATDRIQRTFGDAYGTLPTATRRGYRFLGWFTQAEGGVEITPAVKVSTPFDHSLFAHWEEDLHRVTFKTAEGAGSTLSTFDVLDGYSLEEMLILRGISETTFTGGDSRGALWKNEQGEWFAMTDPVNDDLTLIAEWFEKETAGTVTASIPSGEIVENGTIVTLTGTVPGAGFVVLIGGSEDPAADGTLSGGSLRIRYSDATFDPAFVCTDGTVGAYVVTITAISRKNGFADGPILRLQYAVNSPLGTVDPEDLAAEGMTVEQVPDELWCHLIPEEGQEVGEYCYTAAQMKPEIHVYYGNRLLTSGKDYSVSYRNNVSVSNKSASLIVTGKGVYKGRLVKEYQIVPASLNSERISCETVTLPATGKKITPTFAVKDGTRKLSQGRDYKVISPGGECKEPGTYHFTLEGCGNYTGSKAVELVLTNAVMMSAVSVAPIKAQTYQKGISAKPALTVTYKGETLTLGTDYTVTYRNNDRPGTAVAVLTAKNTSPSAAEGSDTPVFYGSKTVSFRIAGTAISKARVSLSQTTFLYTGAQLRPSVTVTLGGTALTENEDYILTYSDPDSIGTGIVTITGIGGYVGCIRRSYKIEKCNISGQLTIGTGEAITASYTKKGAVPDVEVRLGGQLLTPGTDYKLTTTGRRRAGDTGTLTVTGIGNYCGKQTASFTVTKTDLKDVTITCSKVKATGRKGALKPIPVLTDGSGRKLVAGVDFDKNALRYYYAEATVLKNGVVRRPGTLVMDSDIPKSGTVLKVTVPAKAGGNYTGSTIGYYTVR